MQAFEHVSPGSVPNALPYLSGGREKSLVMAGGTDLLTEMQDRIVAPKRVVDLKSIRDLDLITFDPAEGLHLGALVTLARIQKNPSIQTHYPALAQAAAAVGTPQIRNQGTIGGNLCQRPRCPYFRDPDLRCVRRGGRACHSVDGENRYHAVFGGGPCFIVHPSDTAPALIALDAKVTIVGPDGSRQIPLEDFFILPEDDPEKENILRPEEILTEIDLPSPAENQGSTYIKSAQRESWDFALVSAASSLTLKGDVCENARIVLGGVAPRPWRVPGAEAALKGKVIDEGTASSAAEAALQGAEPMGQNGYKIDLGKAVVKRAILLSAESVR